MNFFFWNGVLPSNETVVKNLFLEHNLAMYFPVASLTFPGKRIKRCDCKYKPEKVNVGSVDVSAVTIMYFCCVFNFSSEFY